MRRATAPGGSRPRGSWRPRSLVASALVATAVTATAVAVRSRRTDDILSPTASGLDLIRESEVRADIAFLTSDALQGRLSLQPGNDAAARRIAETFAAAGLEPVALDARGKPSYLQAVPLIETHPDREATQLIWHRESGDRIWKSPELFGAFPENIDLAGSLVFAGYGITAPELGYDDYAEVDVKGKIVMVFEHEPQETDPSSRFNGTGNTRYASWFAKVTTAQEHGALAVLLAPEPSYHHPSAQEIRARIGHQVEHAAKPIPAQALADGPLRIPNLVISAAIRDQLMATSDRSPLDLQRAIDKEAKPQSFAVPGGSVSLRLRNRSRREAIAWNVVGLVKGREPGLATETVIISAHHDHDGESGGNVWRGADDNASGTAGAMALARAFAGSPAKPRRSILFAVFAAEERGLLGSHHLAAHPLRSLATTRALINFDMIGRNEAPSPQTDGLIDIPTDTSNRLNLIGAPYSPDYLHVVRDENKHVKLVLDDRFDRESALNILSRSDHYPFILRGIPSLWWFTGFHPDYHRPGDTEAKINYPKMMRILKLAYLSAWRFAEDIEPPRFVTDPRGLTSESGS
jgi:Peptidase family M28/PA domain